MKQKLQLHRKVQILSTSCAIWKGTDTIELIATDPQHVPARNGTNPYMKELYLKLRSYYANGELDGFGLYLFAVVLRHSGYEKGVASKTEPVRVDAELFGNSGSTVEEKKDSAETRKSLDKLSSRRILIESIVQYPWNWSAWMELASLSPFTSHVCGPFFVSYIIFGCF